MLSTFGYRKKCIASKLWEKVAHDATNSLLLALFKRRINIWNCKDYKCNACRSIFITLSNMKDQAFCESKISYRLLVLN